MKITIEKIDQHYLVTIAHCTGEERKIIDTEQLADLIYDKFYASSYLIHDKIAERKARIAQVRELQTLVRKLIPSFIVEGSNWNDLKSDTPAAAIQLVRDAFSGTDVDFNHILYGLSFKSVDGKIVEQA